MKTIPEMVQDPDELAFLHSVLAQTFLPYRDPKTRDYVRESGRASLVLTAGYLLDPATRKPVLQGIPYGTKPRLLLVHLCTQAIVPLEGGRFLRLLCVSTSNG